MQDTCITVNGHMYVLIFHDQLENVALIMVGFFGAYKRMSPSLSLTVIYLAFGS